MKTQEEITARLGHSVVVLGLLCITLATIIVLMLNDRYTTDVEIGVNEITKVPAPSPAPKENYVPGPDGIDGKKLFRQNCAVCHSTGTAEGTGPGLEGVMSRIPSEEWLHKWIKNADAVKKSGDVYAVKLDKKYPFATMNIFTHLKDEEINAIIDYLEVEAK